MILFLILFLEINIHKAIVKFPKNQLYPAPIIPICLGSRYVNNTVIADIPIYVRITGLLFFFILLIAVNNELYAKGKLPNIKIIRRCREFVA